MFEIPMINNKARRCAEYGGYPLFYICKDGGALCPTCVDANREEIDTAEEYGDDQWNVVAAEINWESTDLTCSNCGDEIESAYGED